MPKPPLAVHIIHHPDGVEGRQLALHLHRALCKDAALPGLQVPTRFCPEDGSGLPPASIGLAEAQLTFVVVLVDDHMAAEPDDLPAGRQSWSDFVRDLGVSCTEEGHTFLPVALSQHAWPLHEYFRRHRTNFAPAFAQDVPDRPAWLERRVVHDVLRALIGEGGEQVPYSLFLSHTKLDLDLDPKVFRQVAAHLDATQPVKSWVDSAEIDGGSRFDEAIENGVRRSALLVLLTDHYSSRTWCRQEVLLAKRHGRPILVVDALQHFDGRSFPYLGNVPVVTWEKAGAQGAVTLMLKEALRHEHTARVLARAADADDVVLPTQPELATLVALDMNRGEVLYPDPPLGDEELALLAPMGTSLSTPLQRASQGRLLKDKAIALSMSECTDLAEWGLHLDHLDAAMVEISRHLLCRGATLAYGGHLGNKGYTDKLFDLVRAHRDHSHLPPWERIKNVVGWPLPRPSLEQRAANRFLATFSCLPRPDGVEDLDPDSFVESPRFFGADSPARRYAWARGMTAMREWMADVTDARIVLGGKFGPTLGVQADGGVARKWYKGRIPGVIEEALLTLRHGKPLFVVGGFGGAARLVADLVRGRPRPEFSWDFQKQAPHAPELRQLYLDRGDGWWSYPDMTDFLAQRGPGRLNPLGREENLELFETRDLSRIIELLLKGLVRR